MTGLLSPDLSVLRDLPALNRAITLIAATGQEFASRVEDEGPGWLTVARPLDMPAEHELFVGAGLVTKWQADNGISMLPCRLTAARREGMVALWDLDIVGPGWREQRRAYVRTPAVGSVVMTWPSPGSSEQPAEPLAHQAAGALEDISEAALRFVCRPDVESPADLVGTEVEVSLQLRGELFDLRAEVLRVARSELRLRAGDVQPWQVVLRFIAPGRTADELRRIVFREQLRSRNGR